MYTGQNEAPWHRKQERRQKLKAQQDQQNDQAQLDRQFERAGMAGGGGLWNVV